jgi:uncharacterized protein YjbJ (UPF0337 family)
MPDTKKVITGAAIGVAIPAAVGATKKLLGDAGKTASSAKRTTKRAAKRATTSRRSSTPTREQLYRQATRLKIAGRSQMTKAQLQRAVTRAKSKVT